MRAPASLLIVALVSAALTGASFGQNPAVSSDAKAFGKTLIPTAQTMAKKAPDASSVPNYTPPSSQPQAAWASNPAQLDTAAASAGPGNDGYDTVKSSMATRARFARADLDAVVSRSKDIQKDPSLYVSGYGGTPGSCHALPPSPGSAGTYEQTCNVGFIEGKSEPRCPIALTVTTKATYIYQCSDTPGNKKPSCAPLGGCTLTGTIPGKCLQYGGVGGKDCIEPGEPISIYSCTTAVPGYVNNGGGVVIDKIEKNDKACAGFASNPKCSLKADVCVDADPIQRIIDGLSVSQSCWGWTRTYTCTGLTPAQDCSQLEGMGCSFEREECLTGDTPCSTASRVYRCPNPPDPTAKKQYICDGDVYCINGDCQTIDRTPNREFGQAAVALNAANEAGKSLDPDKLTVFKGTRYGCTKAIFGISNCCTPHGFPLLGSCGPDAKILKQQREKGVCHYAGTYCATKALFVCIEERQIYCCYGSKLARILQEQGRAQLGLAWAEPKKEQCAGFTVDQFSHLDLSRMDFSEVMNDFIEAAKLPDSVETANELQRKINAYYDAHK